MRPLARRAKGEERQDQSGMCGRTAMALGRQLRRTRSVGLARMVSLARCTARSVRTVMPYVERFAKAIAAFQFTGSLAKETEKWSCRQRSSCGYEVDSVTSSSSICCPPSMGTRRTDRYPMMPATILSTDSRSAAETFTRSKSSRFHPVRTTSSCTRLATRPPRGRIHILTHFPHLVKSFQTSQTNILTKTKK